MNKNMMSIGLFLAFAMTAHARQEQAQQILPQTGVTGGLVAQVGCGEPADLAALSLNVSFTVVGLDTDAARIAKTRSYLADKGLHGRVSVMNWDGKTLPFTDNLVNLLILVDETQTPRAEIERVLPPGGVLLNLKAKTAERIWRKPRSADLDDWSHYLHDSSNNAVSKDKVVAPPKGLQWWAGPYSSRSHNWAPSTGAMVSCGGRLFYLRDEGPIAAMPHKGAGMNWAMLRAEMPPMPEEWSLIARDAFNGKELWRRPLEGFGQTQFEDPGYGPTQWNIWSLPLSVKRRLVATPDRVYVTLKYRGGLSALDPATGKTLWDYMPPENTAVDEIIVQQDLVFVRVRREIPRKGEAPYTREGVDQPWAKGHPGEAYDKYVESQPPEMVAAVDASTGRERWRFDAPRVGAETLCALDGAVAYYDGTHVVCREAADGRERWRQPAEPYAKGGKYHRQSYYIGSGMGFLFLWNGRAYFSGGEGTTCFDLANGQKLWTAPIQHGMGFGHPTGLWVVNGKLINESPWQGPCDALTGKYLGKFLKEGPWGSTHGRCHRGVMTERYYMGIAFGIEFYDLATGEMVSDNRWLRSECALGYLPANGLLYHSPDPCACWLGGRIRGYEAFAPSAPAVDYDRLDESERLHKGPAFAGQADESDKSDPSDWPQYRHDGLRSGQASCAVPTHLKVLWRAQLGSPYDWRGHNIVSGLTPPTIAGGKAFVARKDANEIVCLDAGTGKVLWRHLTPALVDSPPAIVGGIAVFGCCDGAVYALRASDGALAWRFQAAPAAIMTLFEGRPGSKWPVHGSVLVQGGAVYCAAGHSSFLDGGIHFFKLDPQMGRLLGHARVEGPRYPFHEQNPFVEAKTDQWGRVERNPDGYHPAFVDIEGHRADILVSDGTDIRMGQTRLTAEMKVSSILREQVAGTAVKRRWLRPLHLFLDDTYYHRAGWHYSDTYYGGANAAGAANAGKLLVFDDQFSYGAQWEGTDAGRYPNHLLGRGTRLNKDRLATSNEAEGFDARRKDKPVWSVDLPLIVRGMCLADAPGGEKSGLLFVAGAVEKKPDEPDQLAPYRGNGPANLWILSTADGKKTAEIALSAQPVFDGLAAARSRLFASLADGSVVCLGMRE